MPSMGNSQSLPDDASQQDDEYPAKDHPPPKDDVPEDDGTPPEPKVKRKKKKPKRERVKTVTEEEQQQPEDETEQTETATTTTAEKTKRKKKNRQTSQEEESAQALLALNKGLPADVAAAEPELDVVDDDPEPELEPEQDQDQGEDDSPSKKKKSRRSSRKQKHKPKLEMPPSASPEALPSPPPLLSADPNPPPAIVLPPAEDINHHLDTEIPDSDRIISQHLAAHMSKHNPPPPIPDLHDVLMTDDFPPDDPLLDLSLATPRKKSKTYKRKRPNGAELDNVDPALRELDEATAAAAAAAAAAASDILDSDLSPKNKRKRRLPTDTLERKPPRTRKDLPSAATPNGAGGTFSLEERHAIDTHLNSYMREHGLSHADLCSRVWSNDRKKDDFWESVCGVLPNRSRASIYKHVRRSYHVFQQRAKWTTEDDEELARLVAEKGSSWKDVGDAMGRMGEDCRDRWRNYVKCGKERGRDRWGEDEEAELKRVLRVVIAGIRAGRGTDVQPDEVDLDADEVEGEEDVNWTSVSELMENRRSRIQCRYKWNKMKQQKARLGLGAGTSRAQAMWKKRKVKVAVEDMKVGDQIWLLEQIRDSTAKEEKAIPWELLSESSTWTSKDLEKAYKTLRSTLQHRRLPLSEILSRLLSELCALPDAVKTLRYNPDADPPALQQYAEQHQYAVYPPPPPQQQQQQTEYEREMAMVDPALIGQGVHVPMVSQSELEKTAGEAMLIAEAAEQARVLEEGETERELRRRLGV